MFEITNKFPKMSEYEVAKIALELWREGIMEDGGPFDYAKCVQVVKIAHVLIDNEDRQEKVE